MQPALPIWAYPHAHMYRQVRNIDMAVMYATCMGPYIFGIVDGLQSADL